MNKTQQTTQTKSNSNNKQNYIYDLETYSNFFCGVFQNHEGTKVFEISSRRNDSKELLKFYTTQINYAIGFNNLGFDAQVLEYLIENPDSTPEELFRFVQSKLIGDDNKFKPYAEHKLSVPQIDLYLINHFNNKARATSLKWLEFQIDYPNIQDLPYKFDTVLEDYEMDHVLEYCKNDVDATREFANRCKSLITLRLQQQQQYPDLNIRNKSDSSLGELIFLQFMADTMGVDKKELKEQRTHRGPIKVSDILLPYINFKTPEFQELLEFYKNAESGGIARSVVYQGLTYEFGEGGLHASWENRIFEADSEYMILDLDVSSFYPNLAIVNGYRPEHLGDAFSKVYKDIYEKRKQFAKGTVENLSYKLLLNSVYGKSGDEHSFLFDKKMTLSICINGQLLLTMLAERLSFIPDLTVIQANTDGITVKFKRSDIDKVNDVAQRWQKLTSLELEDAEYDKMVISNVNNYAARYAGTGKIKEKGGLYATTTEFHKNKSQNVVRIALREFFFNDVPVEDTIRNHIKSSPNAIYDYCLGRKVKWNQQFVLIKGMNETKIDQKVIRYYMTNCDSTIMMKKYDDGRIESVNKGYRPKLFQTYSEESDYGIDFDFYINEAYKVTTPFFNGNPKIGYQLSLFD